MSKNDYFSTLDSLYMGENINGFLRGMFAGMDRRNHIQKLKDAGIEPNPETNRFGVPSKGIPIAYTNIDFIHKKFYVCFVDDDTAEKQMIDVYKEDGSLLFTAEEGGFKYLGADDIFLIKDGEFYRLHTEQGKPTTKPLFKPQRFSEFEKSEFCVLTYKKYGKECVINKKGEIVFEHEGYSYLYLYGCVLSNDKHYINLYTGEPICKKGYSHTLKAGKFMFVEVDEQVFKIDTTTGEFEVFGEPKRSPVINDTPLVSGSDVTVAEVLPKVIKQGRNDICNCGSGKKHKHCCGK